MRPRLARTRSFEEYQSRVSESNRSGPRNRLTLIAFVIGAALIFAFFVFHATMTKRWKLGELAAIVPAGACGYAEVECMDYDDAAARLLSLAFGWAAAHQLGDLQGINVKDIEFRAAIAIYRAEDFQAGLPSYVAVVEWKDTDSAQGLDEDWIRAMGFRSGNGSGDYFGWTMLECDDSIPIFLARRDQARIFSNSEARLKLAVLLAAGETNISLSNDSCSCPAASG